MSRLLFLWLAAAGAAAQAPPAFEVVSVKPSLPNGPYRVTTRIEADSLYFENPTLRECLLRAFDLKPYQLTGPDWISQERFVITAKAPEPAPKESILAMFRTLLADRFKLEFHREKRELPIYALVVSKSGPKLTEAKDDSVSEISGGAAAEFRGVSMQMLANALASSLDRPVLDETGLKGKYDFKLAWSERKRKGPPTGDSASDAPSIFTSLPAMLGLKLDPRRAPVEMLIVDHVERPAAN
jgi:uncharacterized protein (TIGR03435 family)